MFRELTPILTNKKLTNDHQDPSLNNFSLEDKDHGVDQQKLNKTEEKDIPVKRDSKLIHALSEIPSNRDNKKHRELCENSK